MMLPSLALPNYPVEAFPKIIRDAIWEVGANVQAPQAVIAMSFLSAMSTTAQGSIKVRHPITGQQKPVGLYLLVVAESGERKTTCDELANAPLRQFDESSEVQHIEALRRFKGDHLLWRSIQQRLLKRLVDTACDTDTTTAFTSDELSTHAELEPVRPRLRRRILQDTTERALLDAVEGRSEAVAIISDEGEVVLKSPLLVKYGVINKLWDGGAIVLNRADGVSFSARDPRVTLSVMTQASVLRDFIRRRGDTSRGTGFFARFLMAWPSSTQGYRFQMNQEANWEKLGKFHAQLTERLHEQHRGGFPGETIYELDDDAKLLFNEIINRVEGLMQPNQYFSDIHDSASKVGENILRVAALLHHFSEQSGNISRDGIERARQIVGFHIDEFKRIFSAEHKPPQVVTDTQTLVNYLHRTVWMPGYSYAPRNDVYRSGPIRDYARFQAAIEMLCMNGTISIQITPPTKKRHICLSPHFFSSFKPC